MNKLIKQAEYWAIMDDTGKYIQQDTRNGQMEVYEDIQSCQKVYEMLNGRYWNLKIIPVYVSLEKVT